MTKCQQCGKPVKPIIRKYCGMKCAADHAKRKYYLKSKTKKEKN